MPWLLIEIILVESNICSMPYTPHALVSDDTLSVNHVHKYEALDEIGWLFV